MSLLKVGKKVTALFIRLGYRCLSKVVPIHKKTCLFISFHGKGYSDNPKAIYEKMKCMPQFSEFNMVWAIRNHKKRIFRLKAQKWLNISVSLIFIILQDQLFGSLIAKCRLIS